MWKTVLFDLDGTLTDSAEGITNCFAYALEKGFGIRVEDPKTLRRYIGQPLHESFSECGSLDEEQAKEAVRLYRERYLPVGIYENRLYPGIPELLTELVSMGFTLAVASSKPTVMCETVLRHFGIRQHFALVLGSELDGRRTHKDEVIGEILRIFGLSEKKEEVVLVGDSPFDVKGAKAAGIDCVSVSYGYGKREDLESLWPACIVDSVGELRNVLVGQFLAGSSPSGQVSDPLRAWEAKQEEGLEGKRKEGQGGGNAVGQLGTPQAAFQGNLPAGQAETASWREQPLPPAAVLYSVPVFYGSQGYAPASSGSYPVRQGYAPASREYSPTSQGYASLPQGTVAVLPEEEKKSRWFGYRKSRDGHPFMAFWRVVWPPLAAFLITEVVALAASFVLAILVSLRSGGAGHLFDLGSSFEQFLYSSVPQITILADGLAFILVFFLFRADERLRTKMRWDDRLLKRPSNWRIGFFTAVAAGCFACIFFNWLLALFDTGSLDPVYREMEEQIMTHSDPAVMVFATVIVAPIFEDLLFRGILYRRLRDVLNVPLAIVLSAATFGLYHGNIIQFLYATALGMIFALLYEHYGTVLVPILAHLGANLTSEILNYLFPTLWGEGISFILALVISGALLAVLLCLVVRKKNRVNRL